MSQISATILGCEGLSLGAEERRFLAQAQPWGMILFARNIDTPDQIRRLTGDLRETLGRDVPILIDQEGGRVQRLVAPRWRQWLPPLDQMRAAGPEAGPRSMYLRYRLIADELHALGIDSNCAPLSDIAEADTHPFLYNRCYGETADQVIAASRAVSDGLLAGGVLPVLKHIPGHGRARADSHLNLPRVETDAATLRATDFAPFTALNDLPMAMTAHIVYAALDADAAATTSATMIGVIRSEIGFDGLLMTDDISMQALSGDLGQRCRASIAAGCDVVLHCNGDLAEMRQVVEDSGTLTGAAATRADRAIAARQTPDAIDIAAVEAELAALLGENVYG